MSIITQYPFLGLSLGVFVMSFTFAKALSYIIAQKPYWMQLAAVALTFIGSIGVWYLTQPATNPRVLRPFAYFLFVVWIVAVPLALLAVLSYMASRVRSPLLRNAALVVVAAAVSFVWPFFALSSLCNSGLDCI